LASTQNSFWENRKAGKIAVAESEAKAAESEAKAKVKVAELNASARKYDAITATAKKDAELAKARRAEIMASGGKKGGKTLFDEDDDDEIVPPSTKSASLALLGSLGSSLIGGLFTVKKSSKEPSSEIDLSISPPGYKTPLVKKKKKAAEYSDDYSDDAAVEYSDDSVDTTPPKTKTPVVAKTVAKKTAPASVAKTVVAEPFAVELRGVEKTMQVVDPEKKKGGYIFKALVGSKYRHLSVAQLQEQYVSSVVIGNSRTYRLIKEIKPAYEDFGKETLQTMNTFAHIVGYDAQRKDVLFVPFGFPDPLVTDPLEDLVHVKELVAFRQDVKGKWVLIHVDHGKYPNATNGSQRYKNIHVKNGKKDQFSDEIELLMRRFSFLKDGKSLDSDGWTVMDDADALTGGFTNVITNPETRTRDGIDYAHIESGAIACAYLWNLFRPQEQWELSKFEPKDCRVHVIDKLVELLSNYLKSNGALKNQRTSLQSFVPGAPKP
jgi:hypothetical protein